MLLRTIDSTCLDVEQLTIHPVAIHKPRDPENLTQPGYTKPNFSLRSRFRRQLWAIVAGFTSLFGLYEANQVRHLHDELGRNLVNQKQQATVIQHLDTRVTQMNKDISQLDAALKDLLTLEETVTDQLQETTWLLARLSHLREFGTHVTRASTIVHSLYEGRLSTHVVTKDMAIDILDRVKVEGTIMGGFPIITHHEDLYQMPVTFSSTEPFRFRIFIHIGIAKEALRLQRYRPTPLLVKKGGHILVLDVHPEKTLLAHSNNIHQELSEVELAACTHRGKIYMCDGPAAFHTRLRRTCLGSLLTGDVHSIQELCPIRTSTTTWNAEALTNDRVSLYFRDPTSIQITCPKQTRDNRVLHGNVLVHLPPNCTLTGDDLRITGRTDILVAAPNVVFPAWDSNILLQGQTPKEVIRIRAHLQERLVEVQRDLVQLRRQAIHQMTIDDRLYKTDIQDYVFYVLSFFNVLFLIVLLVQYCRAYRRNLPPIA